MLTGLRTDLAMPVHVGVALAFRGAGAREGDAGRELRFEKLTVPDLVGAGQDADGRGADRGAIVIEANAGDQAFDMLFGEAGVGAGGTGFDAGGACLDALAYRIGVTGALRMRPEHGSDGNGGHEYFPCERACPITRPAALGSAREKFRTTSNVPEHSPDWLKELIRWP
jgi:hypothetical protein